jgi:hypothetical protein
MEQVHRLDGTSYPMLEGSIRCEWSNAVGDEKYRKTIPEGMTQRANLFAITRSEGKLKPVVELYKQQLMVGINMPGRFMVSIAITTRNSPNSLTLKEHFLFEWTDYNNIKLTPWPKASPLDPSA